MKNPRKLIIYITLFLIFILSLSRLFISLHLPIMGDGGIIALGVEEFSIGITPNYINSPPLFQVINSILFLVSDFYKFIPALLGILTPIIIFILVLELFDSYSMSVIVSFLAAINPYHMLFSSVFFVESTLVFFIMVVMYCHLRFVKSQRVSWLILTGIFLGVCISLKQIGYFMVPILLIQHFILNIKINRFKKWLNSIILIFLIALIVSFPFLFYFFNNTGTILEPNNPFLSGKQINNESMQIIYQENNFQYNHLNRYLDFESMTSFYNPSLYSYVHGHFPELFFIILVLFGIILMFLYKPRKAFYLISFIVSFHIILTILQTQKYFIQSKLLIMIFMIYPVYFLMKQKNKNLKICAVIISVFIVLFSFQLFSLGLYDNYNWDKHMCWIPSEGKMSNLINAYNWIYLNSNRGDVVADPCTNEAVYYAKREVYWLSPYKSPDFYLGISLHNKSLVLSGAEQERIRYLVIIKNLIATNKPNTIQFLKQEDYSFIHENFITSFNETGVEIYTIR